MADVISYFEVWAPTGRMKLDKETNQEKPEPWAKVGVAFPIKDGNGFTIKLNSLPLDGTLIVRPPRPKGEFKGKESPPAVEGI
jgi:hypothetical protein